MLKITYFGNPVLRKKSKPLSLTEIKSPETKKLISEIKSMVETKKYGIGLACPQVGKSLALSVIAIKPTPTRPNLKKFNSVIINPSYEGIGRKYQLWEGCISSGNGESTLYAKVPRYKKINAVYYDQTGKKIKQILEGIRAHVFQHETDHLNGVLFVDKVKDTSSYMLASEYKKMRAKENAKKSKR